MAGERDALRDWHRLFGMVLTDFFIDSPFKVAVEQDLSVQQQILDVVIVRKGPGRFDERLPDGLEGLVAHNLITFKSHHESLDDWAMKELVGHYVAYRKMVSRSPSELLGANQFRLYAVTARHPQNLSARVPWRRIQDAVYDCDWGTDTIRVVVSGELPRKDHNAPLLLFSARPELVGFGGSKYRRRSKTTSTLLEQVFTGLRREGVVMPFTMEDFKRQYIRDGFAELPTEEQQAILKSLPREKLLAALPAELREQVDQQSKKRPAPARKSRRKK